MNHLNKIVASREQCEKLIQLGIEPVGLSIWHVNKPTAKDGTMEEYEDNWSVQYLSEETAPEYWDGLFVPAWTKEEIETMVGPEYNHSDLKQKSLLGRGELPGDAEERKLFVPDYFVVYLIKSEMRFKNGADAAACELTFGIENNLVKFEEANNRYKKIYLERQ